MTTGTPAVSRHHRRIPVATTGVAPGSFPPASLASGRGKLTLALLCAVAFLALAAVSVVNITLPSIRRDLHMPVQNVQWILSGYLLTFGGFMLLGGRSADLFGRRRVLLAGTTLFAVSSFVAGLAQSSGALIGARLAQGLGGAMLLPAALPILTPRFEAGTDSRPALRPSGAAPPHT